MHIFKIITVSDRTEEKLETTRWVVKPEVQEKTWDELIKRLQRLFSTRSTHFFVSWYDGTDYCSIRDWQDLLEAVEFFADSNEYPDKAVRLYVSLTKRDLPTIFGERPPKDEELDSEAEFGTVDHSDLETSVDLESSVSDALVPDEVSALAGEFVLTNLESSTAPSEVEHAVEKASEVPIEQTPQPAAGQIVYPTMPGLPQQPMMPMMPPFNYFGMYPIPYPQPQPATVPVSLPDQPVSMPSIEQTTNRQSTLTAQELVQPPVQPAVQPTITPHVQPELSPAIASAPAPPSYSHPSKKPESCKGGSKTAYIKMALENLRSMGYTYDEKKLKPVIKAKKGNLNEIIDEISKW